MQTGDLKILSIDIAATPNQQVEIVAGIAPKVQCKNQFFQRLFIKLFGYKIKYKTVNAKVIKTKASDFSVGKQTDTFCIEIAP